MAWLPEEWGQHGGFLAGVAFVLWLLWKLFGGYAMRLLRPADQNLLHEIMAQLRELRADVREARDELAQVKERVSHIEGQLRHLL